MKLKEIIEDARTRSNKNVKEILLARITGGGGHELKDGLSAELILGKPNKYIFSSLAGKLTG